MLRTSSFALTVLGVVLATGSVFAQAGRYEVDAKKSLVSIHVGKSGAFSFAGHSHDVITSSIKGEVVATPDDLSRSSVKLTFDSAGLRVSEKGEPEGDAPKVQAAMAGPKLLDTMKFPAITFASTAVSGKSTSAGVYDLEVVGNLTLHGVSQSIRVLVQVKIQGDQLIASGRFPLKQTAFGLAPISAVGGSVKVKDELAIEFTIAAARGR